MKCVTCGQEVIEKANFCAKCGAKLRKSESLSQNFETITGQSVVPGGTTEAIKDTAWPEAVVVVFAAMAAVAVKVPVLFGYYLDNGVLDSSFYARNASLFVLPLLTGYFAWKRRFCWKGCICLSLPFVVAAVVANGFPFITGGSTEMLTTLHLPIALWLVVGIAYTGGHWTDGG